MKATTKSIKNKSTSAGVTHLIMTTPGAESQIARLGGFSRSYACKVVRGKKRPSERFCAAVVAWLHNFHRRTIAEIALRELGETADREGER